MANWGLRVWPGEGTRWQASSLVSSDVYLKKKNALKSSLVFEGHINSADIWEAGGHGLWRTRDDGENRETGRWGKAKDGRKVGDRGRGRMGKVGDGGIWNMQTPLLSHQFCSELSRENKGLVSDLICLRPQ